MHRSDLPELYKDLLKLREDQQHPNRNIYLENLMASLAWKIQPEGSRFWSTCHKATTVDQLPQIPESSIQELIDLTIAQPPMNTDLILDTDNQALHPEFQALAQRRREELGHCGSTELDKNKLFYAFIWHSSPEGQRFWERVNRACATDADLALATEANRGYNKHSATKKEQLTPEPKKHSTMEDVFKGINRHAKKENNTNKEKLTEEDKELLSKLETVSSEQSQPSTRNDGSNPRTTGEEDSTRQGSSS